MNRGPAVAIIADDVLQRHRLQCALGKYGVPVTFNGSPERYLTSADEITASLAIVEMPDESDHADLLDKLLSRDDCTVLFGPGAAPSPGNQEYVRWERRLFDKLESQCGRLEELDNEASLEVLDDQSKAEPEQVTIPMPPWLEPVPEGTPAKSVWVLGASLGGPAAVKSFLDHLPAGLPVGFLYAQHIDAQFCAVLGRVLGRHARYRLLPAVTGERISCGQVVQVPVDQELTINDDGTMMLHDRPWQGPYGPSIDQVINNTARHYGEHCHTILFSGMGNDGSLAGPQLREQGGQVWVQTPETCASGAMPESAAATGCVHFTGDPVELARRLVRWVEDQHLLGPGNRRSTA